MVTEELGSSKFKAYPLDFIYISFSVTFHEWRSHYLLGFIVSIRQTDKQTYKWQVLKHGTEKKIAHKDEEEVNLSLFIKI